MQKLKIYFGHSKELDYLKYYEQIEQANSLKDYEIILPHKIDKMHLNGIEFYNKDNIDLFIAEVSFKATGLGIELGVSYASEIPIVCFYKKGITPNNSLKSVTTIFIEYENLEDFIIKLSNFLTIYLNQNEDNYNARVRDKKES